MSFVPRRYPAQKAAERKTRVRRKPNWDGTTNDLTVHKASAEEQTRRKLVHQSKNMDLVKADLMRKTLRNAKMQEKGQGNAKKKNSSLLREVLFDESQLHAALASSDRALAVVKDIFGDDPKKYRGLPNVTMAPENSSMDSSLPDTATLDGPFKLDMLSNSVMDKSALNDLDASDALSSDSDAGCEVEMSYQPALDMQRFQRLLQQAQHDEANDRSHRQLIAKIADTEKLPKPQIAASISVPQAQVSADISLDEPVTHEGSYLAETPITTPQPLVKTTAINDTENVKRTMARTSRQGSVAPPCDKALLDDETESAILSDMKRVLNGVEAGLANCDGQAEPAHHEQHQQDQTFSSYAMALVNTVDRLTSFVKETEMKLRVERTLREHLSEEVMHMKLLVDALTSDIISSQEENARMNLEFSKFKTSAELDILLLKKALQSHGIGVQDVGISATEQPSQYSAVSTQQSDEPRRLAVPRDVVVSLPKPQLPPAPTKPPPCQPAFMLSPPKQTMSPMVPGGKVQLNIDSIQSAVRALKHPQRSGSTSWQQSAPPPATAAISERGDSNRIVSQPAFVPHNGAGDAPPSSVIDHQMAQAEVERAALQRQLEELNLQHANAQNKLECLMNDHQLTLDAVPKQDTTRDKYSVSPSLSPISLASEHHHHQHHHPASAQLQPTIWGVSTEGVKQGSTREIRVSVPRVDMLEDSPSPSSLQPAR